VELGAADYKSYSRLNGKPSALTIVYLSPGANAVETMARVKAFMEDAKKSFPAGIDYKFSYDSTRFVGAAIQDVVMTLFTAVGLVIIVVFLFLQDWRATLIPLLAVPVSILGTLALFPILGFNINMTSMFGLVLAIGIVVDDAIVVVEAVQHNIDNGMMPREATLRAMHEVSGPVVAIACILGAVFIPVAFLGGISGQIYRQFALTIAASVLISAFNALSLSPAMSALLLRPKSQSRGWVARAFGVFNRAFDWTTNKYLAGVRGFIRRSALAVVALLAFFFAAGFLFKSLHAGFLPDEDQGVFFGAVRLPDGASLERTQRVTADVEERVHAIPGVSDVTTFGGTDFTTSTSNSNTATLIVALDPWEQRKAKDLHLDSILAKAQRQFNQVQEALVFGFGLPPILGLSTTGGFEFMLEDRAGGDISQLADAAQVIVDAARQRPELANVSSSFRATVPQFKVELNTEKAQTMGVPVTDVYNALEIFLGGLYVNDFNRFGRTWRVLMQAEPEYRDHPEDVDRYYVRTASGAMVPLSTLVSVKPMSGPEVIYRYNRFRTSKIVGQPALGYSSGQAAAAMDEVARTSMPTGFGYEWTGTVYQQKLSQGKEGYLFGFAGVMVFLFLAALYESWAIPFSVMLAVPLGLFGALLANWLRSYDYDIYTQIGIVTLIGLAAKNAILIVEYARLRREEGLTIEASAIEAAHLRLRPILMTSFAFILGVVPLTIANGAGAASRRALGTTVFGGMNAATLLAVFFVPVLYVLVDRIAERRKKTAAVIDPHPVEGAGD
jgi:multidrug efflux pump